MITTSDDSEFASIRHEGFPGGSINAYEGDINTLSRKEMLALSPEFGGRVYTFDIPPEGFAHYREMKELEGQAVAKIETHVRRYLESGAFQ